MSETTSDAFLNGQGIPVDLDQVESELSRLWGPSAERVGGPDLDHPTVTRVSLANLVVASLGSDPGRVLAVLDTVVARRPCRAIVLRSSNDPARQVSAEISALCHLPAPGLPQVCSERILLAAGPNAMDLLPGAVRSLLEPDIPLVVWWDGDPRPHLDLLRDLATEAGRLVPDLPDPEAEIDALRVALDLDINPHTRDLAWFGITRWRELVAQFFDPPGSEAILPRIRSVQIDAVSPSVGRLPRVSAWLTSWLAGQLGWSPRARRQAEPERLEAVFEGPSGDVAVTLKTAIDSEVPFAQVRGVVLSAEGSDGEETFRLSRPSGQPDEVSIETCAAGRCAWPRLVLAPEFDAAHRVAAALESSREDPPYRHALPHLFWLLGG